MTEIFNIGNLPKHLQIMAKEVMGQRSTKFFEMSNAIELLDHAKNGNCEETTTTIDKESNTGFMVAFSFNDTQLEDLSGEKLIIMNVFFAKLDDAETKYYRNMLHKHRQEQEDAMIRRNESKKTPNYKIKGIIND